MFRFLYEYLKMDSCPPNDDECSPDCSPKDYSDDYDRDDFCNPDFYCGPYE